jgi:DNA-binding NarL/FixJ family response regulator
MIRVLIAADDAAVRTRLETLIADAPGVDLVGTFPLGADAVEQAEAARADVVLLNPDPIDLRLPELCRAFRLAAVILITSNDSDALRFRALRAGVKAVGYADLSGPELIDSITRCAAGERVLYGQLGLPAHLVGASRYSDRQLTVLRLVLEGRSHRAIAQTLGISTTEVKQHVAAVLRVLRS